MLRKRFSERWPVYNGLASLLHDIKRDLIGVLRTRLGATTALWLAAICWAAWRVLTFAALLALGPAAELGVGPRGFCFGFGLRATEQRADVNFSPAVRTLFGHRPHDSPANAYESCTKSK